MLDEAPRVGTELDVTGDHQPQPLRFLAEELGVVTPRRALLPEHPHLGVALRGEPLRAHHPFGRHVAVGDGEAVLAGEAPRPRPRDHRHLAPVHQLLDLQRVVGDLGAEHHHAPLIAEPLVALARLEEVLPRQPPGVGDHDAYRPVVHALVQRILDREDARIHPVRHQLTGVHVDEQADLHRLERITLGLQATRGRIDHDVGVRTRADLATALVPLRVPRLLGWGVGTRTHVGDRALLLGDAVVDRFGEHPLHEVIRADWCQSSQFSSGRRHAGTLHPSACAGNSNCER